MFRVRCQNFITVPNKNTIFRNDFELTSDSNHNGQKIYDQIPFCGKASVRNPEYIFRQEEMKNVYLENYPTVSIVFTVNYFCLAIDCNNLTINILFSRFVTFCYCIE